MKNDNLEETLFEFVKSKYIPDTFSDNDLKEIKKIIKNLDYEFLSRSEVVEEINTDRLENEKVSDFINFLQKYKNDCYKFSVEYDTWGIVTISIIREYKESEEERFERLASKIIEHINAKRKRQYNKELNRKNRLAKIDKEIKKLQKEKEQLIDKNKHM